MTFRHWRRRASGIGQDAISTLCKELVGRVSAELLRVVRRSLQRGTYRPRSIQGNDDARDRQGVVVYRVSDRADWHLASAAEPIDDGAFSFQRNGGGVIV